MATLFESFQSTKDGELGLGLPLCRTIAEPASSKAHDQLLNRNCSWNRSVQFACGSVSGWTTL